MSSREDAESRIKVMSLIWMSLTSGVVTFAAVAYGLITFGGVRIDALPASLMPVVAPALMVPMVFGIVVGHRLERRIAPDASESEKLDAYMAARIIAMALQEGPGIAIIVFSLLSGSPGWAIAAAGVSVWTLFLARPKREDVERLLRG